MKPTVFSVAVTAALLAGSSAQATVIGFDGLPGSNGSAFSGPYVEDGYSVVKTLGDVYEGHVFGNPQPSLVVGSVFGGRTGSVAVSKVGGGSFSLTSFDFTSQNGVGTYSVAGSLNGSNVFLFGGGGNFGAAWQTILGNSPHVDSLVFDFVAGGTSINFDNIVLGAVPEPSSWAMMIAGFGLVGAAARRRKVALAA